MKNNKITAEEQDTNFENFVLREKLVGENGWAIYLADRRMHITHIYYLC